MNFAARLLTIVLALTVAMGAAPKINVPTVIPLENPYAGKGKAGAAKITIRDMVSDCLQYWDEDKVLYTDAEYTKAIYELGLIWVGAEPGDEEARHYRGWMEALMECRARDQVQAAANRAVTSCDALMKEQTAAEQIALLATVGDYGTYYSEAVKWSRKFEPALKKCFSSLSCRANNKKDMAYALKVYKHLFFGPVSMMTPASLNNMKICGVTLRDIEKECEQKSGDPEDDAFHLVCTDAKTLGAALTKLKSMQPPPPPTPPGFVGGGGPTGG